MKLLFSTLIFLSILPLVFAANLKIESTYINITLDSAVQNETNKSLINFMIRTEDNHFIKNLTFGENVSDSFEIRLIRDIPVCSNFTGENLTDSCVRFMENYNNDLGSIVGNLTRCSESRGSLITFNEHFKAQCDVLNDPVNLSLKSPVYANCKNSETNLQGQLNECSNKKAELDTRISTLGSRNILWGGGGLIIGILGLLAYQGKIFGKSRQEKEILYRDDGYKREKYEKDDLELEGL